MKPYSEIFLVMKITEIIVFRNNSARCLIIILYLIYSILIDQLIIKEVLICFVS